MDSLDLPFLSSARIAVDLVARSAVRRLWDAGSVLPLMTVGMLACHLGRQVVRAREILPVAAIGDPLAEPGEHYRRAAWVTAESLDDPAMDRGRDQQEAAAGYDAMVARTQTALHEVTELVTAGGAQPVVTIAWQGWSLRRDDFLLTRLVEIIVHADDLARSIGIATPRFPPAAFQPVLHVLADLAAERHGQAALISALSRSERQPPTISAF